MVTVLGINTPADVQVQLLTTTLVVCEALCEHRQPSVVEVGVVVDLGTYAG